MGTINIVARRMLTVGFLKNRMRWEITKCAIIRRNEQEVEDNQWKFYVGGGVVSKVLKTPLLELTLAIQEKKDILYIRRGERQ